MLSQITDAVQKACVYALYENLPIRASSLWTICSICLELVKPVSLKVEFLTKLDFTWLVPYEHLQDQEKKRQELIKDIVEGKFAINK